jgi:hypothetical protein
LKRTDAAMLFHTGIGCQAEGEAPDTNPNP